MALAMVSASCGGDDESDDVACEVGVGDSRSTVTFAAVEGESADATAGDYLFTFVVLPESRLRARVTTGADEFVLEQEMSVSGGEGLMPRPDGDLSFSCARPAVRQ
jgi:hypothetical protein